MTHILIEIVNLFWVVKYRQQMFKAAVGVSDKIVFVLDRR